MSKSGELVHLINSEIILRAEHNIPFKKLFNQTTSVGVIGWRRMFIGTMVMQYCRENNIEPIATLDPLFMVGFLLTYDLTNSIVGPSEMRPDQTDAIDTANVAVVDALFVSGPECIHNYMLWLVDSYRPSKTPTVDAMFVQAIVAIEHLLRDIDEVMLGAMKLLPAGDLQMLETSRDWFNENNHPKTAELLNEFYTTYCNIYGVENVKPDTSELAEVK